jgi:hypothetical protein
MNLARGHSYPARNRIFAAMRRASPNWQSSSGRTYTLGSVCMGFTGRVIGFRVDCCIGGTSPETGIS